MPPARRCLLVANPTAQSGRNQERIPGAPIASAAFFDSAGWGISARVLARRNRDRERVESHQHLREIYRDELVYAGALLKTFLESYAVSDKFAAEVTADGAPRFIEGL